MKSLFAFAPLLLLSPLLRAPATDLTFGVEKGKKVTKTFESHMELELSDFSVKLGENEIPKESLPEMEVTMSMKDVLEVVDEYGALEDGLPAKVTRTYEKAQREEHEHQAQAGGEAKDEDKNKTSELEGKQVTFTRKDGEYKASFGEKGGDEAALEKLKEDMDLRDILPGKAVSPGDTWKIPTRKVLEALSPGGRNGFKKEEGKEDDDELFDENFKGESEATFKELKEEDGHKYAVIVLTIQGETSAPKKLEGDQEGKMGLEVDLEGEVLWDIAAKRFHSFEVQGDATMTMEFVQAGDAGGQQFEAAIKIEMKGKMTSKGTASE